MVFLTQVKHVCIGTGPLATLDEYVTRSHTDDLDDRGGVMALCLLSKWRGLNLVFGS